MSRKAEMRRMSPIGPMRPMRPMRLLSLLGLLLGLLSLTSCYREPPLHLYDSENKIINLPIVELRLDIYWDYELSLGINYNWREEWFYGWDDIDREIFGELEYVVPTNFFLRRYYTGNRPYASRLYKREAYVQGRSFRSAYDWGFWDILVWNDVETIDGVQSLYFDEPTSLDEPIIASTNQTMNLVRYHGRRYQHSFWEPEQLFSACEMGIEINENLEGFEYDALNNLWIRRLNMLLEPITYIYLPQIILHHNYGRIASVPGTACLSGMARTTNINTGVAGTDAIAVNYGMRLKNNIIVKGEDVDIVGGRLMTFGICGQNANRVSRSEENNDNERHFIEMQMQFYNGIDSTFVFDVTEQVRERYKGGVITVHLDMDTVRIPKYNGMFDAVIKDTEDGGTWEIEM